MILAILALACAMRVPAMFAQTANQELGEPHGSNHVAHMVQHRVSYLTTVLSRTATQQTQITSLLTNAATNQSTVHASMRPAHATLKTAVRSNDAAGMEQSANTIGTLAAQAALAHARADAALYQLLTPERQTKMTQLEGAEPHGPHEFGGPGGPGL